MKKTVFTFLLVSLITGIVGLINYDPGQFILAYGSISIESNLWIALLVLISVLLLFSLLSKLISNLVSLFKVTGYLSEKKLRKQVIKMITAIVKKDWYNAHACIRSINCYRDEPAYALWHAHIAYHNKQYTHAKRLLIDYPVTTEASLLYAEIDLANNQPEQAIETLEPIAKKNNPAVNELLVNAYESMGKWDKVLDVLRQWKALNADNLLIKYRVVIPKYMASSDIQDTQSAVAILSGWNNMPSVCKQDSVIVNAYVNQLLVVGEDKKAQSIIENYIDKFTWDEALIGQYRLIANRDLSKLLETAEKWLTDQPQSPALLLSLGHICLSLELWGKSKAYLEKSFQHDASLTTLKLYIKILKELGQDQEANRVLEKWIAT